MNTEVQKNVQEGYVVRGGYSRSEILSGFTCDGCGNKLVISANSSSKEDVWLAV